MHADNDRQHRAEKDDAAHRARERGAFQCREVSDTSNTATTYAGTIDFRSSVRIYPEANGARDPVTIASIVVRMVAVSVAACYVPARRAMRLDPVAALRYE